ncbi:MAG TPA: Crp/Fnr family transcriptional regulator [Chitinophagales bacterium]|nr:Crp/Fnr family transcriptional regulator [Chitinophagales bacterium]MCB9075529.1 Crp/Fnr family transcriptional regulator [Chitinophagales bacterium]HMU98854.1 Crp/Fnr family transcriptional regulator [Chitinophagales bacterium]HMV03766.1 Crp/Fnr family transcriptional regulator [Chitinophagales bacterium]HMW95145.1 Crp/Fnr family transcriptional regulator [Chitinophagales bacterium]
MIEIRFADFLSSNSTLEPTLMEALLNRCKNVHIKKGDFWLRAGEACQQTLFVENGLLRYYSIDDKGKEHLLQFAPEGWFVSDRASIFFNEPSAYFIQALEDTEAIILDESFMLDLAKKDVSFMEFNNKLLHNHIRQLQNRINQLLSASAEERYLHFTRIYPDILLRVPQLMVASYLGITPESLSRVRKELAQRNHKS